MEVTIDISNLQRKIRGLRKSLVDTSPGMEKVGRALVKHVKENIKAGGNPKWEGLAKTTIYVKGHRRPLKGFENLVTHTSARRTVELKVQKKGVGWHPIMHHRGFYSREVDAELMKMVRQRTSAKIFFISRQESVVPRRPFYRQDELRELAVTTLRVWFKSNVS